MEQATDRVDQAPQAFKGKTSKQWKDHWQQELSSEEKRNKDWRKKADQVVSRYLDKRKDQGPQYNIGTAESRVNLFHANTFTLKSFLYGRVPTTQVSRAFDDTNDDQARVAANILQRMLNTSITTDGGDFTSVLRADLEDWLVPGLGVARVRYEVETETVTQGAILADDGQLLAEESTEERMVYEDASIDYVHWRDFGWGYGRTWSDIPWIKYDIYLTKDKAAKRFGGQKANCLTYQERRKEADSENEQNPDTRNPAKTAKICEIWDKDTLSVFWYADEIDWILDATPDPLGLPGFFSCPKPLIANDSTTLFQPVPFYIMAQDLYNEVDQLSTRINIITNAVKVVGVYDQSMPAIRRMLAETIENDLVPVDNWAMAAEKGGVRGMVDFWPVETIVTVLDKLRELRAEAIALLHEVTGMSDIMRGGGGDQYEAAAKSRLKAKFGSIRVQYLQDEFARFASDLLTLKAQVICHHFEPQTIIEQSNVLRSYDAPLVDPAVQLIKTPSAIPWRVDVKPETVAMVDWAELKAERTEFLTAMATFLQSSAGILQIEPGAMPLLLEFMKWGLAGFKGGQEIESVVDRFVQRAVQSLQKRQGQQEPSEEDQKARADMQKTQVKLMADLKKQQDKHVKEMQKLTAQLQADLETIRADTRATIVKEVVQADQNIREQKAKMRTE